MKGSENHVMSTPRRFLQLRPLQVTRPIARSINVTSTSSRRQIRRAKLNRIVRIMPQILLATPVLHRPDTAYPYHIFRATPAKKPITSRIPYQKNQSFQSWKLLRDTTVEQYITEHAVKPSHQHGIAGQCKATCPGWHRKLWRRWKRTSSSPHHHLTDVRPQQHPWERSNVGTVLPCQEYLSNDIQQQYVHRYLHPTIFASENTTEPLIQKKPFDHTRRSSVIFSRRLQTTKK